MIASLIATQVALLTGLELMANDPYLTRKGATLAVEARPVPILGFGVLAGLYPNLAEGDWTHLTADLINENQVSPHLSRVISRARASVHLVPIRTEVGKLHSELGVFGGAGFVQTEDDLQSVQAQGIKRYENLANESHFHPSWGLTAETGNQTLGVRARLESSWYTESIGPDTHRKDALWAGIDLVIWQR